jgi:PAS domain S-box-containing protein
MSESAAPARLRVLVLEDSPDDAELAIALLEREGLACAARRVERAAEFEQAIAREPWDLVLADYSLPGYSGAEALAALRARDDALPFIFISGTLGEERAIESLRAGATDYVLKHNLARLAPAVRRALADHRNHLAHVATQRALEASERRYSGIVEDQPELICRFTPEGVLTFANGAFCRYFGRAYDALIGTSFLALFPPEEQARLRSRWLALTPEQPIAQLEHRGQDAAGRLRWQGWSVRALFEADGRLAEIQAVGRDVTELVETLDALRASEARFERVLTGATDGYWDWDLEENRVYYSPSFRAQLGLAEIDAFSSELDFIDLIHPDDRSRTASALRRAVDDGAEFREEFRLRQADGDYAWFLGRGERVKGEDGAPHFAGSITRAADRQRMDESLKSALERLRHLSRRVIGALESERAHLARELHDQLGQVLTAVKIKLQTLGRQSPVPSMTGPLEETVRVVDTAIEQVRRMSRDLRPPQLDDLGLVAALRAHLHAQAELGKLRAHFDAPEDLPPLAEDLEIAVFRIAQEALTNVLRHAQATGVWLELTVTSRDLTLVVQDDGVGFGAGAETTHLGLVSMEERAQLAGGSMRVASIPGSGTEVRASFPLRTR